MKESHILICISSTFHITKILPCSQPEFLTICANCLFSDIFLLSQEAVLIFHGIPPSHWSVKAMVFGFYEDFTWPWNSAQAEFSGAAFQGCNVHRNWFCYRCHGHRRRGKLQCGAKAALLSGPSLCPQEQHPHHGWSHCIYWHGHSEYTNKMIKDLPGESHLP